jgi:protein-S-isoprenylcysteine O-methyltransferase Ste14
MSESNQRNRGLGVLRLLITYAAVGALLTYAAPTPRSWLSGIPFVIAGEWVRWWAAGHLRKTVELITSGPYRYTRNPLYLGRLLIFIGLAVIGELPRHANLWVLGIGLAIFFFYYMPRKERIEPARLLKTLGESYAAYRKAVPALFPRLTPWPGGTDHKWRPERMLVNREQWMVIGLLLACGFMALKAWN